MNSMHGLEPAAVWRMFELICSIPHPSGHEAHLAERLAELARRHGLTARFDAAGNLRIDRAAAPGFATAPTVILQGHLDMVSQARPDVKIDFTRDPIKPIVRNGRVETDGTTLGADDGIGVAMAMAMLLDDESKTGPLAGLFTVQEEVGLIGAKQLAPDMLKGDYLLNLDRGDETQLCIGCAGGCRQEFGFVPAVEVCSGGIGVRIMLGGLKGGHSGSCIHDKRGNSLIFMARFINSAPELRIASVNGGDADNAIPRDAVAVGVSAAGMAALQARADAFVSGLRGEFDTPAEFKIAIEAVPAPERLWTPEFQNRLLNAVAKAPNAVFEFDAKLNIVRTSSNLAAIRSTPGNVLVRTSQRSLSDAARGAASTRLRQHFEDIGGVTQVSGEYPSWEPKENSRLLELAQAVHTGCYNHPGKVGAIHAGLESGLFSKLNPSLELLAIGPTEYNIHTPTEYVEIASIQGFFRFAVELVRRLSAEPAAAAGVVVAE